MSAAWTWLQSDRSLALRVGVGVGILAVLAIVDYARHRARATRWREYAFLLVCTALAVAYGIANDLVTSRLSVEYFLYFKGVVERVPIEVAADPDGHRGAIDRQAMRIGALATWSVGLLVGAAILTANTLGRAPRLRVRRLLPVVPVVFACALACAAAGGWLGWTDRLPWIRASFDEPSLRPQRLRCVYAIHLGGYVGGAVGTVFACAAVVARRRREGRASPASAAGS